MLQISLQLTSSMRSYDYVQINTVKKLSKNPDKFK